MFKAIKVNSCTLDTSTISITNMQVICVSQHIMEREDTSHSNNANKEKREERQRNKTKQQRGSWTALAAAYSSNPAAGTINGGKVCCID